MAPRSLTGLHGLLNVKHPLQVVTFSAFHWHLLTREQSNIAHTTKAQATMCIFTTFSPYCLLTSQLVVQWHPNRNILRKENSALLSMPIVACWDIFAFFYDLAGALEYSDLRSNALDLHNILRSLWFQRWRYIGFLVTQDAMSSGFSRTVLENARKLTSTEETSL